MSRTVSYGLITLLFLSGAICALAQDSAEEQESIELVTGDVPANEDRQISREELPIDLLDARIKSASDQARTDSQRAISAPDVYLLPDRQGKLRKVLGFQYEDFRKAWHAKQASEARFQIPRYAVQSIDIRGEVVPSKVSSGESYNQYAKLRITLQVKLDGGQPIEVPLQMGSLLVQRYNLQSGNLHPESSDPNEQKIDRDPNEFLLFDETRNGYVAWLRSEQSQLRTLVVEGLVPISHIRDESALQLALPRAVQAKLQLHVPYVKAVGHVTNNEILTTTASSGKGTDFRVDGILGQCKLHWSTPLQSTSGRGPTLQSTDEIVVKVDQQGVRYEAVMHIEDLHGQSDRFQLRMPPGAKLLNETSSPDYEIVPVDYSFDVSENTREHRTMVEVRLREPRQDPLTIQLSAARDFEEDTDERTVDLAGFELIGAVRQTGNVTLDMSEQLLGYFDVEGSIRQIELENLPDRLRQPKPRAAFFHSRAEWAIRLHTEVQKPQVRVQPNYELEISKGSSKLQVQLNYQFTGVKPPALLIDMRGWKLTVDPLESSGAIDRSRYQEKKSQGLLVLPLIKSDARQVNLRFTAGRESKIDTNRWPLPEPKGAIVLHGNLKVTSKPSLKITPLMREMIGLATQSAPQETTSSDNSAVLENAQVESLYFSLFLRETEFRAEVTERKRQTSASVDVHVQIDRAAAQVEQKLSYRVDYQPLTQLAISVPTDLYHNDSLVFFLNDELLEPVHPIDGQAIDPGESGQLRNVLFDLPDPLQGDFNLVLQYELPIGELQSETTVPLLIPLADPKEPATAFHATVDVEEPLLVALQAPENESSPTWSIVDRSLEEPLLEQSGSTSTDAALRLTSRVAMPVLPLALQVDTLDQQTKTILDRAWLQTWIQGSTRQERSVYRFRTEQSSVLINLPLPLANNQVEILLDGYPVATEQVALDRIAIPINSGQQRSEHTLEVRYQTPISASRIERIEVSAVQLECRQANARCYWQLVLPRYLHVVNNPENMTPESQLGWNNYRWGRQPTQSQLDLEQWTGATAEPTPSPISNEYLYSTFNFPQVLRVVVVSRSWLTFVGAASAFCVGLLIIYTSVGQRGIFWLSLSIAILALVSMYPEITILAVQCILVGGVLTLMTVALRRALVGPGEYSSHAAIGSSDVVTHAASTEPWLHQTRPDSAAEEEATTALQVGEPAS